MASKWTKAWGTIDYFEQLVDVKYDEVMYLKATADKLHVQKLMLSLQVKIEEEECLVVMPGHKVENRWG